SPVIALPISAVPEAAGDCAYYTDGLSAAALARAMERLAADPALCHDLRARGLAWVEQFRWERTALETFEVYRSTVLQPSERSLRMRRILREPIMRWSGSHSTEGLTKMSDTVADVMPQSMGIKNAVKSLRIALRSRFRRELRRFPPLV